MSRNTAPELTPRVFSLLESIRLQRRDDRLQHGRSQVQPEAVTDTGPEDEVLPAATYATEPPPPDAEEECDLVAARNRALAKADEYRAGLEEGRPDLKLGDLVPLVQNAVSRQLELDLFMPQPTRKLARFHSEEVWVLGERARTWARLRDFMHQRVMPDREAGWDRPTALSKALNVAAFEARAIETTARLRGALALAGSIERNRNVPKEVVEARARHVLAVRDELWGLMVGPITADYDNFLTGADHLHAHLFGKAGLRDMQHRLDRVVDVLTHSAYQSKLTVFRNDDLVGRLLAAVQLTYRLAENARE